MHSQQQQYWNYAKRRDLALKKSLQKNFTEPIFPFPEFPDDVLAPVAADEASDEGAEAAEEDWRAAPATHQIREFLPFSFS